MTINNKTNPSVTLDAETEIVDASKRIKSIKITGNARANSITGGRGKDTLDGLNGNNTLTGGTGADTFLYGGGKNVITDYEKQDKINIGGGLSYAGFAVDDNDLILNFGNADSLTITDGAGKAVNLNSTVNFYTSEGILDKNKKSIILANSADSFSATNYSQLKMIDGTASGAIEIVGNNKANSIVAGSSGSTLNGGKGKDTLVGGTGADIFVYANKSGKDVIEDYGTNDKISLGADVTIKDAKIRDDNLVIKVKQGSITVNDTTEVTLTSDGNDTIFSGGVFVTEDSLKVIGGYKGTIDLTENLKNVDASLAKKKLTINGNAEDNLLVGSKGEDKIYGKDKIYGNAGNDTLWGGKGNDSLWGGDGNDTFIFQAGTGKDTIFDYTSGELLQILDIEGREGGSFRKSTFKNDTLTLTINDGGKVIFNGVDTSTSFNINGNSYRVNGNFLTPNS